MAAWTAFFDTVGIVVSPALAQTHIEIVVVPMPTPNLVMPGAAFSSKPGDQYISRMWFLSGAEQSALRAGKELPQTERATGMLESMVQRIIADGWRPAGRGQYWYSFRFSR